MKRVLLISPYFPPMGVIGAKRPLHLVRHLPREGWSPIVLAADPSDSMQDQTLLDAIPEDTIISYGYDKSFWRRLLPARQSPKPTAKGSQRRLQLPLWLQYATATDRYRIHHRTALRAGLDLIEEHKPEIIHVIADPWSGLLVAESLHLRTGLPFVCDFRDPWSQHDQKMAVCPPWTRARIRKLEARIFAVASKVILNSDACQQAYIAAYRDQLPASHFARVRNAFDRGLFHPTNASLAPPFTASYFGTFRFLVAASPLLNGFKRFVDVRNLAPTDVRLQFAGTMQASDWDQVRALGLTDYVTVHPPIDYRDSLSFLQSSHLLLLVAGQSRKLQIPGKLYDYLAAGRPILGISANEEVNRILVETSTGRAANPQEPSAIAEAFGHFYDAEMEDGEDEIGPQKTVLSFSAEEQSRQIATIYNEVCEG